MNKEKQENSYKLNTKAVDDLINASEDASDVSEQDLKRYRSKSGFLSKWPVPLKMAFIKFWFSGAICFFFIWGLGIYVSNIVDMLFITSVAMGFVTDILVNNLIRFMADTNGQYDRWMMFPKKRFVSLIFNVLYAMLLTLCVYELYTFINLIIINLSSDASRLPLGVEPILFGLFYMGFDMLFLGLKKLLKTIVSDAKSKVEKGE